MRWQELFADLDGQFTAAEQADLAAEVRDRTRREQAAVRLVDRLGAAVGQELGLQVHGGGRLTGRLRDVGPDWLLLEESGGREVLVASGALLGMTGLGRATEVAGWQGEVARRLTLAWALRGLARSRAGVAVVLRDGAGLDGTLDRVGADYAELAEHPAGEPRRAGAVRQVRLVPVAAMSLIRTLG